MDETAPGGGDDEVKKTTTILLMLPVIRKLDIHIVGDFVGVCYTRVVLVYVIY